MHIPLTLLSFTPIIIILLLFVCLSDFHPGGVVLPCGASSCASSHLRLQCYVLCLWPNWKWKSMNTHMFIPPSLSLSWSFFPFLGYDFLILNMHCPAVLLIQTHTMFGIMNAAPNLSTSSSFTEGRRGAHSHHHHSNVGGEDLRGLIPRCLEFIFTSLSVQQRKKTASSADGGVRSKVSSLDGLGDFHCSCQFLEVYMEQVHDLLDPNCPVLKV